MSKYPSVKLFFGFFAFLLITGFQVAAQGSFPRVMKQDLREQSKAAAVHAWNGYTKYARGMDDLEPLTKKGKNWYKHSMLMTPVDAFDTFVMLGLKTEASEAKQLILAGLNFNLDNDVQVFEVTIRLLGGLISAYQLDPDIRFLQLATDLGDRMMPAFNSSTGMPYRYVHLQSGVVRDAVNNPAEIGTLMMEFGQLSKLTGNNKYYDAAKKAIMYVYDKRSPLNLVGEQIDVNSGNWVKTRSHISGYIDSYYEYLHKCWLLFGDKDFKIAFEIHNKAIKKHLLHPTQNGTFMQVVDMNSGKSVAKTYGALDAFYAGLCAFAGDKKTARKVQQANYYMWTKFGMEPEEFDFVKDSITAPYYILRPENLESCFYLYRGTKDNSYLWMGKRMLEDIIKNCKTEEAYAAIKNVRTNEKMNSMQSFFFAETLKYAYLLFADEKEVDLKKWVFNTEAHPFKILTSPK